MNDNPLLTFSEFPDFKNIKPEHIEPAIDQLLADNLKQIDELLDSTSEYTWENLIEPLDELDDRLNRAWSPVSHMNSVVNSDELRDAYNNCLPMLSEYGTKIGQHKGLFKAYEQLSHLDNLNDHQRKVIENSLRDFRLSGIDLDDEKQKRYGEISQQLSQLTSQFSDNLLDASNAWIYQTSDKEELAGLPESSLALAKQNAEEREKEGWVFTLDFPSYYPVMTYADSQALRQKLYEAYNTRASDQGPDAGKFDNSQLMRDILKLRHEKAQLLGFNNYAELSLAKKMAPSIDAVLDFLTDLAEKSHPQAESELIALKTFAKDNHGIEELNAWDIGYYAEKLRQERYAITQEEVKPYFPQDKVVQGMFEVVKRLYGIKIETIENDNVWHPDVQFFKVTDSSDEIRGYFYLDLYARQHKRGGAWMDECLVRFTSSQRQQLPVAYLTCNFTPPVEDKPALLTHDEVETLFHEFGHGLHHLLTKVDYPEISGINGVAWDAVELPSQFMENWCWEKDALSVISGHWETGEPTPDELYERMKAAKNFQSAMMMVRQLEFSIFDFRIHAEYQPDVDDSYIYDVLNQVRQQVAVIQPPAFNRFANGFAHIFAGGYAAGYYSYKWAEVLSADAFSLFEKNGIFDAQTGQSFLNNILEKGGSQDAMDLFKAFRGREPEIDALLRHTGIAA